FDSISDILPVTTFLYFVIAACVFMAAVDRRKAIVFILVLIAVFIGNIAVGYTLESYLYWEMEHLKSSICDEKNIVPTTLNRVAESELKDMARQLQANVKSSDAIDQGVRAEGRSIIFTVRYKWPIDTGLLDRFMTQDKELFLRGYCSTDFMRTIRATETH